MSSEANGSVGRAESGLIQGSRMAAMLLARLFTIGVVVQVFLVGLFLFEDGEYLEDHRSLGEYLGILPALLIVAAIVGRLPSRLIGMSVTLVALWVVQYILPEIDNGWIAALHPVNAFLLFGLSVDIGNQVRNAMRGQT